MKELLLIAALLAPALGQLGLSPSQMGAVTGRLSRNAQPATGIRVTAMAIPEPGVRVSDAASFASIALTDTDGRYRLENIPPGRYYVTAGFLDVPTYYPGVASIDSAKAVTVEAGVTAERIDFTTASSVGVTVSGRVVSPPGQFVPANRRISLGGPQRPPPEATINADGTFEFSRVRPGNYSLRVPSAAPATIVVGDTDIAGIEIPVPFTVTGNVFVEGGGPLPNLSLSFVSAKPGQEPQNVGLSPGGVFSSQLKEGEYRLAVSGVPTGYVLKSVTAGAVDLLADALMLSGPTPPAPISITLGVVSPSPWVKVRGKVSGPGFPQGGPPSQLTLTSKAFLSPLKSSLDADGSFELPWVLPGEYTLGVKTPAGFGRSISLHVENKDLSGIEISLPATKDVTAIVKSNGPGDIVRYVTQSPPLPNGVGAGTGMVFSVRAGAPTSFELVLTDDSGATSTTVTPQAGGALLVKLPEGERRVTAEVPGQTLKSLSYGSTDLLRNPLLKVSSADTAQLEITLAPSITSAVSNLGNLVSSIAGLRVNLSVALNNSAGTYTVIDSTVMSSAVDTVHIGPDVAQSNLVTAVPLVYPSAARAAGIRDTVVLRADIDKEGAIRNLGVVRGHPLLNDSAIEAVNQWRYRPYLLNGQPTSVTTTISVTFGN